MSAAFSIQHTAIGPSPYWYHLETAKDLQSATRRANNYALDHGGYVCVKDRTGNVVFGTDPDQLSLAILSGTNRHFLGETARRAGCCA